MKLLKHTALACVLALAAMQQAAANDPIDINTASAEVLAQAMSGVGLKRAQAIIAYRNEHGPFADIDDLLGVRGIGPKVLDKARERLTAR
jgi:competence protein ComEA